MEANVGKTQEVQRKAQGNALAQEMGGSESTYQFAQEQPTALAHMQLQAKANESPDVRQLKAYQEAADNSPQVQQLKAIQEIANDSPQVHAAVQLQAKADHFAMQAPVQRQENKTGLPDDLKSGIEGLSGFAMDDVKVHYGSDKPAQLQAHAYAQGTDIHIAPGQEKHLPHEAWHVAQQKQGRVQATTQLKGKVNVNDDAGLEREADEMGAKALQAKADPQTKQLKQASLGQGGSVNQRVVQAKAWVVKGGKWVPVDDKPGPRPSMPAEGEGEVFETDNGGMYRDLADYLKRTGKMSNPAFVAPETPEAAALLGQKVGAVGSGEADKLRDIMRTGILTPGELKGRATLSADDKSVDNRVCVNAFAPTESKDRALHYAKYAATNAANGAIPVVIEQAGDRDPSREAASSASAASSGGIDTEALSVRALQSAMAVIDPSNMGGAQQAAIKPAVAGGGGEVGLDGGIGTGNIVRYLVPIEFMGLIEDNPKVTFVGSKVASVPYNGTRTQVEILMPDYESALAGIFAANPQSVFLTHAFRLGAPNPLGIRPREATLPSGLRDRVAAGTARAKERPEVEKASASVEAPSKAVASSSAPVSGNADVDKVVRELVASWEELHDFMGMEIEDLQFKEYAYLGATAENWPDIIKGLRAALGLPATGGSASAVAAVPPVENDEEEIDLC